PGDRDLGQDVDSHRRLSSGVSVGYGSGGVLVATAVRRARNLVQPSSWSGRASAGRPRWMRRRVVASPAAASSAVSAAVNVTSTWLEPGGTPMLSAVQPQVNTNRWGRSTI